ncbi:hypothetical protein HK105_205199 [Polyrhizophydium stewartii]|uniref:Uncharacterized protein n=1 Tax=Polyrhizophydium stewartii TaxID=2732419 RepID=A0ABR4N792_9FUNG
MGMIIGIVVGAVVVIGGIIGAVVMLRRRNSGGSAKSVPVSLPTHQPMTDRLQSHQSGFEQPKHMAHYGGSGSFASIDNLSSSDPTTVHLALTASSGSISGAQAAIVASRSSARNMRDASQQHHVAGADAHPSEQIFPIVEPHAAEQDFPIMEPRRS